MRKCFVPLFAIAWMAILLAETRLEAAPNFKSLLPFAKRVECDPGQTYDLADTNGPWMVLATSFSGAGAEQQARDLVLELRREYNLEAYQHRRTFDFTKPVTGLGINEYGEPRKMRYRQSVKFDEIAVLVGNFQDAEEPDLQRVLEKLKNARPECLDLTKRRQSAQRFAGLREIQRRLSPDPERRMRGPMGNAFVTRNPLLPDEYFASQGPSSWIFDINKDVEFSLLKCPGRYTVRVATFRGESTMNLSKMDEDDWLRSGPSKLEVAADKAHRLTVALREKGIEAYEFHDEFESMVTIGSFESVGTPRVDGKTEINPAVHAVIESYRAVPEPLGQVMGLKPRTLAGIPFDAQPWPVEVPRFEEPGSIVSSGGRR